MAAAALSAVRVKLQRLLFILMTPRRERRLAPANA